MSKGTLLDVAKIMEEAETSARDADRRLGKNTRKDGRDESRRYDVR